MTTSTVRKKAQRAWLVLHLKSEILPQCPGTMSSNSPIFSGPLRTKQSMERTAGRKSFRMATCLGMIGDRSSAPSLPFSRKLALITLRPCGNSAAKRQRPHHSVMQTQATSRTTCEVNESARSVAKLSVQAFAAIALACALLFRNSLSAWLLVSQLTVPGAACMGFISIFLRPSVKRLSRKLGAAFSHSTGKTRVGRDAVSTPLNWLF